MSPDRMLTRRKFALTTVAGALVGAALAPRAADADGPTSAKPAAAPVPVAVLLDKDATVIDFAGPWEAFQDVDVANEPGFRLFTVAASRAPLRVTGGLQLLPDFTFEDAPESQIIVLGAQGGNDNPHKLEWLRQASTKARMVLSVCTGAFLLARTGLLDGLSATTHHDFYDHFQKSFPKVHVVRDRRFVDNGKFITAGGLTSGVDAALHVIARVNGESVARTTAVYMEHDGDGWISGVRSSTVRASRVIASSATANGHSIL